jgi:hypothetical protein
VKKPQRNQTVRTKITSLTLDESIRLYGPLRNYVELGLPGPDLTKIELNVAPDEKFENDGSENYSFE